MEEEAFSDDQCTKESTTNFGNLFKLAFLSGGTFLASLAGLKYYSRKIGSLNGCCEDVAEIRTPCQQAEEAALKIEGAELAMRVLRRATIINVGFFSLLIAGTISYVYYADPDTDSGRRTFRDKFRYILGINADRQPSTTFSKLYADFTESDGAKATSKSAVE